MPANSPVEEQVAWVARSSYGRLIALLAARFRDIAAAEDARPSTAPYELH